MKTVRETTFAEQHLNHTYFLSDDKFQCLGYIPHGSAKATMFDRPLRFNYKNRKFVEIK